MAVFAGTSAVIKKGGNAVLNMNEWSIDMELDTQEVTSFGKTWKEYLTGCRGWSGSMSGRYDPADTTGQVAIINAILSGTITTLTDVTFIVDSSGTPKAFQIDTTAVTGSCIIITGVSVSTSIDGVAEVSIDFQGSGALKYA